MTAVEFYDRAPIENIISSLTTAPDKIIFIGDGEVLAETLHIYKNFIAKRALNITIDHRAIDKSDINNIVKVLSKIVETEQELVFDLTGGDDLVLVAMGIVYQKYSDKNIRMQRFNMSEDYIIDCDYDGNVLYEGIPQISVAENIELHGGAVRYKKDGETVTRKWGLTDDFQSDINKMWSVCKKDPGRWNAEIDVFSVINKYFVGGLFAKFNLRDLKNKLKAEKVKYTSVNTLLELLNTKKIIRNLVINGDDYSFQYKNDQVQDVFNSAGTLLELKVLSLAKSLETKCGTPLYNSAMSGVFIDWDGDFHSRYDADKDTENEIDVVLMKGTIPVFISCKNGGIKEIEPYKLDAIATRFGGKYVKKALIATYLGTTTDIKHLEKRMQDMNINFIYNVHKLSEEKFAEKIRELVELNEE